jgi:hypothetical protein
MRHTTLMDMAAAPEIPPAMQIEHHTRQSSLRLGRTQEASTLLNG